MAATAYRYLVNLPGVCQGRTIVEGTRIGVHDVVGLIVNGASVDDVLRSFPDLKRSQVFECLAYYEDHRAEIDSLVARQMSAERAALERTVRQLIALAHPDRWPETPLAHELTVALVALRETLRSGTSRPPTGR